MRFNEKELASLSRQPSEMAAELGMRGPKKGDVVKRRLVKLVVNFLFYFRTDEEEPIGALLLEQCRVEREDSRSFSIAFLDEAERKYLFECDSGEQCGEWVDSIIKASFAPQVTRTSSRDSKRRALLFADMTYTVIIARGCRHSAILRALLTMT
uniref:Pleckstrin homology domain-containing family J member 1 n=1 Tax=Gasterosteus aculeatus aculeatus TaxID=481459 RepID=G3PR81_GASAC